jgi:hypothetical protein
MASAASGELNCTHRVKLFPLPFLSEEVPACSSPVRSARVRSRLRLMRTINIVTNRTVFTLNRLYSNDADIPPVPSSPFAFTSASSIRSRCPPRPSSLNDRDHQLELPLLHQLAARVPSSASSVPVNSDAPSRCSPRLHVRLRSHTASRAQARLILHLRGQCAAFVLRALLTSANRCSDDDINPSATDIFLSYQFDRDHTRSNRIAGSPDQTHTSNHAVRGRDSDHKTSVTALVPPKFSVRPDRIEGPLHDDTMRALHTLPLNSAFSSAATAVVPLIAHRVALPSSLNIVPLINVLPPEMSARYVHAPPAVSSAPPTAPSLLRSAADVWALNLTSPLKPARVVGLRSEYCKLVQRMVQQGMLSFTAHPKAVNGVFTVGKDAESDRLIIDAQPANRLFIDSPHVSLPDPSHLVQLRVPKGWLMFVGKSDLSNYYHHLGLPAWMQPYFALPALTTEELTSLGLDPSLNHPMCVTLPMGFSHAVLLAQSCHEHVVYSSGALRREDGLLRLSSPDVTNDGVVHGIVIDDFFLFSLNQALATRVFRRVLDAYRAAGFVVKPSKVIEPTDQPVKVIGFMFEHAADDDQTTVSLASDSCLDLARVTLAALARGQLTGLGLAHLIGRWTWCMLLRRPSLSVLQHCYRYIEVADRRRFTVWPSVRRELWMLLGLLPLLHARLDVPTFKHAVATDASELGAGVVCSRVTPEMDRHIWQLCSSRAHATMQTLANAAANREDGIDEESSPELHRAAQLYSSFYDAVGAARWSTILSSAWHSAEHINALELRAVLLSLHWLLSYPSAHSSRVYLLVDSTVALFALWKGRSSSPRLLVIIRKISALLLASGTTLLTGWLPSAVNPADQPSRLKPQSNRHDE